MTLAARILSAAALAAVLSPAPALAGQTDSAVFDLTLRGISAGSLSISGAIDGESYVASGVLKSGGLIALVKKVRYDARAHGRYAGGHFTPARYEEDADTGKRQSQSVMDYRAGVPQVKKYNPPKPPKPSDIDPATQGGTVDPLTALFAALRDVPAADACKLAVYLFDGKRRSQVTLADPKPVDAGLSCTGEYRRLEGFSDKDMAEKSRFPFMLRYEPLGNGHLRVVEVTMDTLYGKGRLKRR